MRKIRIGKDILVRWTILTNGLPEPLEGRNLRIVLTNPLRAKETLDFLVDGNVLTCRYPGMAQKHLGTYSLTLWENYGKEGQTAVDSCEAFRLVATTCEESSDTCQNIETSTDLELEQAELDTLPKFGIYSKTVRCIETLTQEEYDAIENPSETTLYIIV